MSTERQRVRANEKVVQREGVNDENAGENGRNERNGCRRMFAGELDFCVKEGGACTKAEVEILKLTKLFSIVKASI